MYGWFISAINFSASSLLESVILSSLGISSGYFVEDQSHWQDSTASNGQIEFK